MKRTLIFVALLVVAVCSGTLALTLARAERSESVPKPVVSVTDRPPVAIRQDSKAYTQDVAKVLKRHDSLVLKTQVVAEQVRQTGKLSIPTAAGTFEMTLAPHDLRAPDYRAEVSLDGSLDGTASERSDYLAAVGTLRFLAGETSKTISVFIVDDSYGEQAENFTVTLSNPVGCVLGTQTVTVTLNSNEAADGPNPVLDASFSSDFFVREHYVDFFNREADPSGLAFWKDQIDSCPDQACREIRRINVSAAFFLSGEFQQTGYLVYKANQAAFASGENLQLRAFLADTQEIGRGVVFGAPGADALLESNKQRFFLDFVQRPAFLAVGAYPTTLTAAQFVDKLNGNTLDPLNPSAGALTQGERDALWSRSCRIRRPRPSGRRCYDLYRRMGSSANGNSTRRLS